jgi:hypothetical protein
LIGSSKQDLPRIRARDPQFRGGFGTKGISGQPKDVGPVAKVPAEAKDAANTKEPADEPNDPKESPTNPSHPNPRANALGEQLASAFGGDLGELTLPSTSGAVPATSLKTSGQQPNIEVLTTAEEVSCREYPDIISLDPSKVTIYPVVSHLEVKCWTQASVTGPKGKVQGSSIWLRAVGGCYISEMNVQNATDFQVVLANCPSVQHWVGTLQTQYKRQDCYDCTSLNCASKNLGATPQVELSCSTVGEMASGNR